MLSYISHTQNDCKFYSILIATLLKSHCKITQFFRINQIKESTESFKFENSLDLGKTILTDPKGFDTGDIFFVNFEKMLITKNGLNAMTKLDLTSDFEAFFIAPDEYINLSSPCDYEVKYKLRSF